MPTAWQTYPVEMKGGLVTNISPLQQGVTLPGSARSLVNFEPSIEGGYRRIEGYTKYDDDYVPPYGEPLVQGSGQSGTTLILGNIYAAPDEGSVFTISGVTGTYTVSSASFSNTQKTATLTITPSLASSPADKAEITFENTSALISGLFYFDQKAVAYRNNDIWESSGSGWSKVNVPSYGGTSINSSGYSGTTVGIKDATTSPKVGDTFKIAGVELVYAITDVTFVTSGNYILTISPALDSSPADDAGVTFLSTDRASGNKHRFVRHFFTGTSNIVCVDGVNKPFKYNGTVFETLSEAPSEVQGAQHVANFKSHIFYAKGNTVTFTAPYSDDDFSPANGAGTITIPHTVTGLVVFREQLIVFSTNTIHRLVGNTISDFQLQPISQDIGCVRTDTIQEVGGDIVFLGPDGLRLLSATDRIGDFGLAVASRPIQSQTEDLVNNNSSFASCVIRQKNQYRIFGFSPNRLARDSYGILGTQFADQTAEGMAWAELKGFLVYVADSIYSGADQNEVVIFANNTGYVYSMEVGNTFDGVNIPAYFYTPFFPISDPQKRKTFYRLTTYIDPQGSVNGSVTPKLDFDGAGLVQPSTITFSNDAATASYYGTAIYGVSTYGGKLRNVFKEQLVGSGFTLSLEYDYEGNDPPFSIDFVAIEFLENDRQ